MKFEGDRTTGRQGPRTREVEGAEREPTATTAPEMPLRARARTYVQPLGTTIDRHFRI